MFFSVRMSSKLLVVVFISFAMMTPVAAMVIGGSNLGFSGYPEPSCRKPIKPYQFVDDYEVSSYNMEVDRYISCVREYVDNANNDIDRIREAAQLAISEARS